MENERTFGALFGLQYPRSPLPNNRTANALVLIDGGLDCDLLGPVLLQENLRLLRLVRSGDESGSPQDPSGPLRCSASEFNFAEPQFVATIMGEGDMFRVHISEPVSTAMSDCDLKLVDYFRALVMNLISRMTGHTLSVVKESFAGEGWHTCVPCLMESPNIQAFLRHALTQHDLHLPTELNLPLSCQMASSYGPLLVLRSESRPRLHILRTLVSLKLAVTAPSPPEPVADLQARQNAELLRVMAEVIKGIHCDNHRLFSPVCSDCNERLAARLGRTKELIPAPVLACLPDLISMTQPPAPSPDSNQLHGRANNKTLKCPMCNWTYKYRETLEQHWRDKHPDVYHNADQDAGRRACPYCQSGAQHPKLSKGEVYPCGYAAYHCHYCGYKTNTKGNLEIHKQSEKHLMNVQKHGRMEFPATTPQFVPAPFLEPAVTQQPILTVNTSLESGLESVPTEFNDRSDFLRCFVCGSFATGSLQALIEHVNVQRDIGEEEYILRVSEPPTVYCKLCPYKTFVKANFSVHCNTEKHRQKVSLLAHILAGDRKRQEGVEWPLRLSNMSPVQILCTACQSIETSISGVERHLQSESHIDAFNTMVFVSERVRELYGRGISDGSLSFECRLCAKKLSNISDLRAHMTSNDHISKAPQVPRNCYTKPNLLKNILSITVDSKSENMGETKSSVIQCPCCPEQLSDNDSLRTHLLSNHNIVESKVDVLCQMATKLDVPNSAKSEQKQTNIDDLKEDLKIVTPIDYDEVSDAFISDHTADKQIYSCDVCPREVTGHVALYEHLNAAKHHEGELNAQKYLCWKKGCNQYFENTATREKHFRKIHTSNYVPENSIYTFDCRICGLGFRSEETFNNHEILHQKLSQHFGIQTCTICHAQIYSTTDLRTHVLGTHTRWAKRGVKKAEDENVVMNSINAVQESTSPRMSTAPAFVPPLASPFTCHLCNVTPTNLAEYRAHERSPEHHQRQVLALLATRLSAPQPVHNFVPLPLGVSNFMHMSSAAQFMAAQSIIEASTLVQMNAARNEESPRSNISTDVESAAALLSARRKTSPTAEVTPTTSPVTAFPTPRPSSKEENSQQPPPTTPNSASSSSSLPTPGQAGLVSPAFSDTPVVPGMLSPLGSYQTPIIVPTPTAPSPATPQEPSRRRGRTRINEEQLQILREHFNINSPPCDALIRQISIQTGLEVKVIKHWYRNTLFKERQRDKDNPYNFSVPPATTLNLAEYERTGKIEVQDAPETKEEEGSGEGNENDDLRTRTEGSEVSNNQRRKRPLEENSHEENTEGNHDNPSQKRARVDSPSRPEETLTFPQLENLMSTYKKDPNLSHEQTAVLAAEIGLSEERVANWFKKARADDCSNLNMLADVAGVAEAETIVAVRCPYCDIIFRLRSRLADHLKVAHTDKPMVDAGSLPDGFTLCHPRYRAWFLSKYVQKQAEAAPAANEEITENSIRLGMSDSLDARPWLSDQEGSERVGSNGMTGAVMSGATSQPAQRRVRTSITPAQSALLRFIYSQNKNPGVTESRKLSDKLSLNRRVVQVWFQNQRAQEKKRSRGNRMSLSSVDYPNSPNTDSDWLPTDTKVLCRSCMNGETDENHIFSDDHLESITSYIESRINAEGLGESTK